MTFKSLLDRLFPTTKGSAEEPAFENPWIVLGLGNPGPEYRDTRHNAGHWCVQRLAEETGAVLENRRLARTGQINIAGSRHRPGPVSYVCQPERGSGGVSAHTIRGRPGTVDRGFGRHKPAGRRHTYTKARERRRAQGPQVDNCGHRHG